MFACLILAALLSFGCGRAPGDLLKRGEAYWADDDLRSAVIELKTLLQDQPRNARGRWLLGSIYLDAEDGPSAIAELEAARALSH